MKTTLLAVLCTAFPALAQADVTVTEPWARASVLGSRPAAVYMSMSSDTGDRLLSVSTPAADQVMIHAIETDDRNVSRMQHREVLELPPGETVTLAPGGMHLMLMGLGEKLVEGSHVPMTFSFEKAGEITTEVPILGVAANGPEDAE